MKTKAVRIHGKMDLRLEEIELPQVGPDDVQVKIISDSICMSTYKAAVEGEEHKRVPNDVAEHPTIVGHEFCGVITEVGENWKNKYKAGQGFAIQPAHFYKGSQMAPGYSYQYCGGDSQYSNIPIETLLTDNLLPYNSDTYFYGSLAEPMSCIIGTFHAMYHTKPGCYEHQMGIVEGGKMAMLASVGPMGLGAIDYALHCDRRPSLLVITDIDDARLARAESIYTVEHAKEMGVELHYVNTAKPGCDTNYLRELSGGTGYDDVICFAPVKPVVEQASDILGFDGCLNFFAGPTNSQFKAEFNWYNVHAEIVGHVQLQLRAHDLDAHGVKGIINMLNFLDRQIQLFQLCGQFRRLNAPVPLCSCDQCGYRSHCILGRGLRILRISHSIAHPHLSGNIAAHRRNCVIITPSCLF